PEELVLAAIVDAELLAVHAAVHDALAGRVRAPVAAYLPGSWLAHCVLAAERPIQAFGLLHPLPAVRAQVVAVEIHDHGTGVRAPV
ncbi:MAG: 2'-5' RNA ligase family protein, partial [Pseudonocardia sp.]